jgi:hypothetical protein
MQWPRWSDVWGYLAWCFLLCMWAGAAGVVRRYKIGAVSFLELAGELFLSGFVGLLTFLACVASGLITFPTPDPTKVAIASMMIAVTAHMGVRAIAIFERAVSTGLRSILGDTVRGRKQ